METDEQRIARQNAERDEEISRVPPQHFDKSKWPKNVRPISLGETGGIGIDDTGRLHWDGRPVEIVGRRLDLTRGQFLMAIIVAIFTTIGGIGAAAQGWAAYHDWACRNKRWSVIECPAPDNHK